MYPIDKVANAWKGAASIWGKAAVVLFYGIVWFLLLWSVWCLTDPSARDPWGCVFGAENDWKEQYGNKVLLRAWDFWDISFLGYAQHVGMTVTNIAFDGVYLICAISTASSFQVGTACSFLYNISPFSTHVHPFPLCFIIHYFLSAAVVFFLHGMIFVTGVDKSDQHTACAVGNTWWFWFIAAIMVLAAVLQHVEENNKKESETSEESKPLVV